MRGINTRQRKFVEAYDGNATEAARKAGYKGNGDTLSVVGCKLLGLAKVKKLIEARQAKEIKALVATRQERQAFWTEVMKSKREEMQSRLRASELLGKSEADFTDKMEVKMNVSLSERLQKARGRVIGLKSNTVTVSASHNGKEGRFNVGGTD